MSTYPSGDIARAALPHKNPKGESAVFPQAPIKAVVPHSPADDAGFEAGCFIVSVDGQPLRDLIDWRWLSAEDLIEVGYIDRQGDAGRVELVREPGEDWGFEFEGVVFDGVKQCRNACIFCFMRQLPDDMRSSLTLRDDDFRLSFLAGTFVTFTNLSPEDEARIIRQRISPLRVSLHACDAHVRRRIIGKHADHGIKVLDRLLAAGIEFHAQIVLMPKINDEEVLSETLTWAYARPGIKDVCIVPLGFTKHQKQFQRSFNDPASARAVMATIAPFQRRALKERGSLWAFAADEFYHHAYGSDVLENLPPTEHYGDFGMFEDGVGIIRSFVDDWEKAEQEGLPAHTAGALQDAHALGYIIMGYAMENVIGPLIRRSALNGILKPLFVKNDFFGGNVDVTGLLCGVDIIKALKHLSFCHQAEKRAGNLLSSRDASDAHQASSARAGQSGGLSVRAQDCRATEHAGCFCGQEGGPAPFEAPLARAGQSGGLSVRAQDCRATEHAGCFCGQEGGPAPFEAPLGRAGQRGAGGGSSHFSVFIPSVLFNDQGITLDDMSLKDMEKAARVELSMVSCNPYDFLQEIANLVGQTSPTSNRINK